MKFLSKGKAVGRMKYEVDPGRLGGGKTTNLMIIPCNVYMSAGNDWFRVTTTVLR